VIVYEIRDLVKTYSGRSRPANDGIDLDIHAGEIFGILGDNGAGKTTLVRQMVNLLSSSSGSIRLFGEPLASARLRVPLAIGYMPQQADALNHLAVGEALYYTAHLRGVGREEARRERDRLLALWRLEDLRGADSASLSGGQRRLLRLAVAMAGSPPVLLLDEPTSDLDPLRRRLVWDVLKSTHADLGTTIIFITHDAAEAEKVIQRVAILKQGKVAGIGRPAELKQRIGRQLRIDLWLRSGRLPTNHADVSCERQGPDHWVAFAEWAQALRLLSGLDPADLDDFRMQSPTLEDLFMHYAGES
jgi:ABC-type multidrug transport system ATPase subunit